MDNKELISEMLGKKIWAVVGVSPNHEKVSNHIFRTLVRNNYETYPVNPKYDVIGDGVKCYHSISELPVVPDCVDFVVPPAVTLKHLKELDPAVIKYVWFQPGTYNDEVISYAEEKGFRAVHDGACVMVALKLAHTGSGS